jgi:hypothetical protein
MDYYTSPNRSVKTYLVTDDDDDDDDEIKRGFKSIIPRVSLDCLLALKVLT